MVKLVIGGVDLHEYLTAYNPSMSIVKGGNDFVANDGTQVIDNIGTKISLSFKMEKLPTDISRQVAAVVKNSSFEVEYTDPMETKGDFTLNTYNSTVKFTDPRNKDFSDTSNITWDVDMAIESIAAADSGSL